MHKNNKRGVRIMKKGGKGKGGKGKGKGC